MCFGQLKVGWCVVHDSGTGALCSISFRKEINNGAADPSATCVARTHTCVPIRTQTVTATVRREQKHRFGSGGCGVGVQEVTLGCNALDWNKLDGFRQWFNPIWSVVSYTVCSDSLYLTGLHYIVIDQIWLGVVFMRSYNNKKSVIFQLNAVKTWNSGLCWFLCSH